MAAGWDSTFPGGTLYYAQLSTNATFAAPVFSSNTLNLSATFSGLTPNTTYYAQVATAPAGPFTSLGSTVTLIQPPSSVYFDEITTHSIVASAYAPTPAFSNLNVGLSGTNLARDGVYAGWHGESWTAKAVLATARYGLSLAALEGRLYAMGGYNGTIQSLNAEYDPAADAWTSKAAMPVPLLAHTALPVEGGVLVSGGDAAGGASDFNRLYSPATNAWTTLASIPAARTGQGAGLSDGRVTLFGGVTTALTATAESYSLSAGTWSARASMPLAIQVMAFATVRDRFYSLGGYTTVYSSAAFEYDPQANAWSAKAILPTPRAWFNAASLGGKVYAFGGQNSTSSALALNEEYDPAADSWATRLALPTTRTRPGVAALGGRIYVAGGIDGTPKNANEVYDPGVAQQFTGLSPNTSYSFRAKARNLNGVETAETAAVSTYTWAAVPAGATPTVTGVFVSSVSLAWTANGNPAGTEYRVHASTAADFNAAASSQTAAWTTALSLAFPGLSPNTTWHFRVRARNAVGVETSYASLGSTVTSIQPPSSVYFDEITTHSIVASAYAPTPAFSNLNVGLSGTNLARDGVYAGWHGERWTAKAAMPTARYGVKAAAVNGRIYAIGGYNGTSQSTNAEYDPVADAWTAKTAMPTARHSFALSALGGKLYAAGGENTGLLATHQEYDPATDAWTTKTSLPSARTQAGSAVFDGRLHLFGGTIGTSLALQDAYDPATDVWQSRTNMPDARNSMGVEVVGGKAYLIGGETASLLAYNKAFDLLSNSWVDKSTMPTARAVFAHGVIGGKIYAVGGKIGAPPGTDAAQEYDPAADTWTARTPIPTKREWMGGAVVAGRLYVIGGSNGSAVAVNEEYDPGVARQFTGLSPNTLYTFKAKARNLHGLETAETETVSTYTWAAVPTGAALAPLGPSSAAFSWSSGGNPSGTQFQAELSLSTSFASPAVTGWGADLSSAVFGSLNAGTTYYARVQARNAVGVPSGYTGTLSTRTPYVPVAGCGLTRDVAKAGAPYGTITAALAAVPASLTVETCVVVRDSATYAEQVTVAGKTPNGFRLRILADPALPVAATVAPPAASTAAFRIQTASVSLEGLTAAPAFPVGWGVYVTSPYASLSAVLVQTTVTLAVAGLELESWGSVEGSTVSVANSRAVYFNGASEHHNVLSRSSFTNASAANHAVWCSGPDNTVEQSAVHNTAGVAVMLGATNCVVDRSTATTGAAGSYAVSFAAGSSSATFSRGFARSGIGRALSLAGSYHTVAESTVTTTGASEYALALTGVTHSTVSRVYAYSATGIPLHLSAGSNWNRVEQSTVVAGGAFSAAYVRASSQNTVAASVISAAGASALEIKEGSYGNAVLGTSLLSGAAAGYALYLTTAAGNAVSDSFVYNSAGYAAFLGVNANANIIDRSTVTALVSGYSALYLDNASTNVVTRSYLWNLAGTGVTFGSGSSSNTLSLSTVAASGATAKAFHLYSAADALIADSWLLGAGYGLYGEFAERGLVMRTTVTGAGAVPAVLVAGSSGVVLRDAYAAGPDALSVYSSTATTLERTRLAATGASGKALQFLGGSNGLSLASATLTAAAYGLVFEDGARGPLAFSSFSVTAATGLRFEGGTMVATLTLGGFAGGPGGNVDAAALSAASRLTLRDASGARAGSLFENDPLWVVDWLPDPNPVVFPDPPAGCASTLFVRQAAGFHCTAIQACVDLVPAGPLAGDACVVVADSGVYSERVVVRGKDPGGYRLRIEAAAGARPVLNPPAGSTAGLRVENSSVSVSGLAVVTTNTVAYGIVVSSPQVALSSVSVDSGGKISGAGIQLGTGAALSYASVTVQNADGVRIVGSGNSISFTSASVTAFSHGAFYLLGASSNTLADSYGSGSPGIGAFLYHAQNNTLSRMSLRNGPGGGFYALGLNDAQGNVVLDSIVSNPGGEGADLAWNSNGNVFERSSFTAGGSLNEGFALLSGRGNRFSWVYVESPGNNALSLYSGAFDTVVEHSTCSTGYVGARALGTNGPGAFTDNLLFAPYGTALGLYGSSVTATLIRGYTATPSYPALHAAGDHLTLRDSVFENLAGDGGKAERSAYLDIARSTISGAGGGAGLRFEGSSSNTVSESRLSAPGGVGLLLTSYLELFDMTTTTGAENSFWGLTIEASTAVQVQASSSVALSSSVLVGDAAGVGLSLVSENSGTLIFSNLAVRSAGTGLALGSSVLVATVSAVDFDASVPLAADATALPAGSRITVRDASGAHGGSLYEEDPLGVVDWVPDAVPFVPPPAPAAPSGTALGPTSISWAWAPVAGAESYRVRGSSDLTPWAAPADTGVVLAGLSPNSTYSIVVAGFAHYLAGPLSLPGTAHTLAAPPTGLAALFVTQSSAAVQWSLNGNPTGTFAELQRSTDAATFSVRAGTLATTAYDAGLVGCTSYYYRVRNRNPIGVNTDFDGPLFVRTPASTPSAPGDLSAQSVPGRRVALTWNPSATEGIVAYRLYKDSGAGQVDYSAPYAQFSGATFSTTTVALSSGVLHLFGLRAVHRCGIEEPNTHAVASAWALESLDGVRAGIKVPASGKKISGNRVLVMAEMDTGDPRDVSSILFQYRSTGSAAWTDIPAANANHPNPDREQPFFVHWDVTGLADRAYDLRAVASDVAGASDPAPGTITVLVDSVGFEVRETDLGGGRVKKEQAVSNETSNTVAAAGSGSAVVTKVVLPAGALNTTDATLSATPNPAALPAPPAAATSLGASIEITLSNGQSLLSGGQTAAIVFNYPDDDGDGVIDGTSIRAENAQIQTFDAVANAWKQEFATAVDKDKRTLTGRTPHFSIFAAFGVQSANLDAIRVYPNPYKPNGGNADEGRPFSRGDPLSGVVFDNLPAVVDIKIYTLTGRLVSSFGTSAGTGALQWDGKNDQGEDVASGGYFAVITSPGASTVVKKIGVIR